MSGEGEGRKVKTFDGSDQTLLLDHKKEDELALVLPSSDADRMAIVGVVREADKTAARQFLATDDPLGEIASSSKTATAAVGNTCIARDGSDGGLGVTEGTDHTTPPIDWSRAHWGRVPFLENLRFLSTCDIYTGKSEIAPPPPVTSIAEERNDHRDRASEDGRTTAIKEKDLNRTCTATSVSGNCGGLEEEEERQSSSTQVRISLSSRASSRCGAAEDTICMVGGAEETTPRGEEYPDSNSIDVDVAVELGVVPDGQEEGHTSSPPKLVRSDHEQPADAKDDQKGSAFYHSFPQRPSTDPSSPRPMAMSARVHSSVDHRETRGGRGGGGGGEHHTPPSFPTFKSSQSHEAYLLHPSSLSTPPFSSSLSPRPPLGSPSSAASSSSPRPRTHYFSPTFLAMPQLLALGQSHATMFGHTSPRNTKSNMQDGGEEVTRNEQQHSGTDTDIDQWFRQACHLSALSNVTYGNECVDTSFSTATCFREKSSTTRGLRDGGVLCGAALSPRRDVVVAPTRILSAPTCTIAVGQLSPLSILNNNDQHGENNQTDSKTAFEKLRWPDKRVQRAMLEEVLRRQEAVTAVVARADLGATDPLLITNTANTCTDTNTSNKADDERCDKSILPPLNEPTVMQQRKKIERERQPTTLFLRDIGKSGRALTPVSSSFVYGDGYVPLSPSPPHHFNRNGAAGGTEVTGRRREAEKALVLRRHYHMFHSSSSSGTAPDACITALPTGLSLLGPSAGLTRGSQLDTNECCWRAGCKDKQKKEKEEKKNGHRGACCPPLIGAHSARSSATPSWMERRLEANMETFRHGPNDGALHVQPSMAIEHSCNYGGGGGGGGGWDRCDAKLIACTDDRNEVPTVEIEQRIGTTTHSRSTLRDENQYTPRADRKPHLVSSQFDMYTAEALYGDSADLINEELEAEANLQRVQNRLVLMNDRLRSSNQATL